MKNPEKRLENFPMPTQPTMNSTLSSPLANSATGAQTLLELDAATFQKSFNRQAFTIRHHLTSHPLLALPRLIELSRSLSAESVEYNAGNASVSQNPDETPRTGLSIEETLRRIEEECSWLVLKNVERDAQYKALLDACLDEIQPHSEPLAPGMCGREAFIFVSSAGSTTPFHIDPEYNFLLQIRGTKSMTVFDRADRAVISEQTLEKYYSGAHRNLEFKPEYEAKGQTFELAPGTGLHVPVTAPHFVKNGDQVSISLSITFQNPENERRRTLYHANAELRKRGLNPAGAGESKLRDGVKVGAYRALRRAGLAGRSK